MHFNCDARTRVSCIGKNISKINTIRRAKNYYLVYWKPRNICRTVFLLATLSHARQCAFRKQITGGTYDPDISRWSSSSRQGWEKLFLMTIKWGERCAVGLPLDDIKTLHNSVASYLSFATAVLSEFAINNKLFNWCTLNLRKLYSR